MSEYEIRNDPLPPRKGEMNKAPKYPWREIEVGQCFYVKPFDGLSLRETCMRMSSLKSWWSKSTGATYTMRTLKDLNVIGIWRVK